MGDFRIIINAIGGHGQDRDKKDGEVVDFGTNTPEAIAKKCVENLLASGIHVVDAKVIHPANRKDKDNIEDDLITGIRKGTFE